MEYRVVEREVDGKFVEVLFTDLKAGDRFKLYDAETAEPRYEDGSTIYTALTDAYAGENGIPQIDTLDNEGRPDWSKVVNN